MKRRESADEYEPREVTRRMILTNQMHKRMLENNLEGTGIHRAQHRLLMTLACNELRSQVELARMLEVSPATIAVSLKSLEKSGLIEKRMGQEDNRVNFVELTEKGQRVVEESRDFFDMLDQQMYQGFTREERMHFRRFLARIYENMHGMAERQSKGGKRWDNTKNI